MASAIPSGCARDARQVGRRTWRPRFFCGPSHCAVHADCVVPLGARSRRLRPTAVIGEIGIPRCTGGLMPPRRDKATCASRMLHPAQRAHGCRPHPYFGTEESVLWNRRKSATGKFQPARGEAVFTKCREPDAAAVRYVVGAEQGTRASPCRGAIAAVREAWLKGSVSMTTVGGPTGRSHRAQAPTSSAPTPSIKHCLNATVRAADGLDAWFRRYVIEHPLRYGASEFRADQSQSAKRQQPVPPFSSTSASHTADQPLVNRPPRNRAAFVGDRSVWLSLGHCLRAHYDALAAPVPPRIAALVEQLDTQK